MWYIPKSQAVPTSEMVIFKHGNVEKTLYFKHIDA